MEGQFGRCANCCPLAGTGRVWRRPMHAGAGRARLVGRESGRSHRDASAARLCSPERAGLARQAAGGGSPRPDAPGRPLTGPLRRPERRPPRITYTEHPVGRGAYVPALDSVGTLTGQPTRFCRQTSLLLPPKPVPPLSARGRPLRDCLGVFPMVFAVWDGDSFPISSWGRPCASSPWGRPMAFPKPIG